MSRSGPPEPLGDAYAPADGGSGSGVGGARSGMAGGSRGGVEGMRLGMAGGGSRGGVGGARSGMAGGSRGGVEGMRSDTAGGSPGGVANTRYGLYVVVLAAILLIAFTIHVALDSHKAGAGVRPGTLIPPFAAPYAIGGPPGEVDVATHANDGTAGRVAACAERGPGILNICQLYERAPVVLALFFQGGPCAAVLDQLHQLAASFPQVSFAAVAVKEEAGSVARLVRAKQLSFPVGVDGEGRLGDLFSMVSCPQIAFVYPGGVVQSRSLLGTQSLATLRARVSELLAASRARGWRPVGT